ncbi:hypothetical protein Tco_0267856 [Tanacetum coccineum]
MLVVLSHVKVEIIPTDLWHAPWLSDQLEWNLWHAPWLSDQLEWNLWPKYKFQLVSMMEIRLKEVAIDVLIGSRGSGGGEESVERDTNLRTEGREEREREGAREKETERSEGGGDETERKGEDARSERKRREEEDEGERGTEVHTKLVHVKSGISLWRGARVDVRTYLLGSAIDSSEANGIIRDLKMRTPDLRRLMSFDVFRKARGVERLHELQGGVRVAREDDRGVTEGREDIREVFQQQGSGAKRKLSRRGRNQMGNDPILALPEGADDFVVYYDARSKDLEACLEKKRRRRIEQEAESMDEVFSEYGFEAKYHLGKANVVVELWSRKKSEAKNEFWIDVRWNSKRGPEFTWEREDYMKSKYPQLVVNRTDE